MSRTFRSAFRTKKARVIKTKKKGAALRKSIIDELLDELLLDDDNRDYDDEHLDFDRLENTYES